MSNKKVAIVTWARGVNYGTILQAFSMNDTLIKHGYDAVLLDDSIVTAQFKEGQFQASDNSLQNANPATNKSNRVSYLFKKAIKAMYVLTSPKRYRNYKNERTFERASSNKKSVFQAFKDSHLKLSKPFSTTDYDTVGNDYDVYICGSDQIWTVHSKPECNYYYLGFTDDSKKRIAYAPCIGEYEIPTDFETDVKNLISRFSAISMRDNHGAKLVSNLYEKQVPVVVDPVLLKTSKEWAEALSLKKYDQKYLLCYILGKHKWYNDYIKSLAKHLNLPIKWIPVNPEQSEFLYGNTDPCGPKEFAELIYNAEFICTDSYHGTLFSLLFNKQFVILERYSDCENSQNERFYSLFGELDIDKEIISEKIFEKTDTNKMDYDIININLSNARNRSLDFLLESID